MLGFSQRLRSPHQQSHLHLVCRSPPSWPQARRGQLGLGGLPQSCAVLQAPPGPGRREGPGDRSEPAEGEGLYFPLNVTDT